MFISQSNYIPWRGYFDAINSVDEFVVYDDVQYTKRDWRNRNRIKTPNGALWLSIPIEVKNKYYQKICEAKISNGSWAFNHWKTLQTNYSKAPYFRTYAPFFEELYLKKKYTYLHEVNYDFIRLICSILNIRTKIVYSSNTSLSPANRTERLLEICKKTAATDYYSGPAASSYLNETLFQNEKINVHYFDYSGYEPYPQLHGDFINQLSVLDLIFNTGPEAYKYLGAHNHSAEEKPKPELILI